MKQSRTERDAGAAAGAKPSSSARAAGSPGVLVLSCCGSTDIPGRGSSELQKNPQKNPQLLLAPSRPRDASTPQQPPIGILHTSVESHFIHSFQRQPAERLKVHVPRSLRQVPLVHGVPPRSQRQPCHLPVKSSSVCRGERRLPRGAALAPRCSSGHAVWQEAPGHPNGSRALPSSGPALRPSCTSSCKAQLPGTRPGPLLHIPGSRGAVPRAALRLLWGTAEVLARAAPSSSPAASPPQSSPTQSRRSSQRVPFSLLTSKFPREDNKIQLIIRQYFSC